MKLYVIIGFAARLVKSVINLLDGQFKLQFKVLIIKVFNCPPVINSRGSIVVLQADLLQ